MAKRIPIDLIASTYRKKGCNVTATCAALGISRFTFYYKRNHIKKLQEELGDAEESLLDFAESKLMEHIQNGDVQTLIFYLRTKGKKRGYVEKTESDVNVNAFERLMRETSDDE